MSLPHLLLVDDSEAVLAFERAALSGHYALSSAVNGRDALDKVSALKPAAVLLDLSMPEMDGDEVLAAMQRDPVLQRIPVIIVSSERRRAEACLRAGAKAFLPKPVRARELLPAVSRVLAEVRRLERAGDLPALFVGAGSLELGLPLALVETVLHMLLTRARRGPAPIGGELELHGSLVPVIDLAARLGVEHALPLEERRLVVLREGALRFALAVDWVRDPVEVPAGDLLPSLPPEQQHAILRAGLIATAGTPRGPVPIVHPRALLGEEAARALEQEHAALGASA